MAHPGSSARLLALLLLSCMGISTAQTSSEAIRQPESRLNGDWRTSAPVAISSATPASSVMADQAAAASDMRLERMLLLLEPSTAQQQALTRELADLQNPASPAYHQWLTANAFADAYANSAGDVAAVAAWLTSEGFEVAPIPAGRGWIEFSGTVGQVEQAFQTQVALAAGGDGPRAVLVGGISAPAAFAPLLQGLVSLDGTLSAAALTTPQAVATPVAGLAAETSLSSLEALTPEALAPLLHLDALHAAGTAGAGQTIAIAARAGASSADVAAFRTAFGLLASALKIVPAGGARGGSALDRAESTMTSSWAGAAAPGAQIALVPAASTSATDGIDLSLAAIVDRALGNSVVVGYSACEAALSATHRAFYAALYRQAAAEGMAVAAAAGDSGPAACDAAGSNGPVTTGYAVNALAATPWNVAVGVAGFDAAGPAAGISALVAWSPVNAADPAYAGGGGGSAVYAAPAWQPATVRAAAEARLGPAISGVSSSGRRLLPDVSLPTALDSAVNRGLVFCLGGDGTSAGCTAMRSGGSSAAAALFGGIAALLAEKDGAQGNLAPGLYSLSSATGVYSDVVQGNTQLACATGSANCDASGQIGFSAAAGYDMATGLGVVNAQALVTQWKARAMANGVASVGLAVTPTAANATYNPSTQVVFTASVVSQSGGGTPIGSVQFVNAATNQALSSSSTVGLDGNGNGSTQPMALSSVFPTPGSYQVAAVYSGDNTYAGLSSQPLTITTQKSCSSLTVVPSTTTPTVGTTMAVTVDFAVNVACGPPAGAASATGIVTLNVSGGVLATYTATWSTVSGVTTATFANVAVNSSMNALQATYGGDGNYAAATSPAVAIGVAKGATVTTVTAMPPALSPAATETLTATIAPLNAASGSTYTITGSVSFYDGGSTLLGTVPVTSNQASLSGVNLAANLSHSITAVYTGDTNWLGSTSAALPLPASTLPDVVVLTSNVSTADPGEAVVLVATVTPVSEPASTAEQNPTGNVIFYSGGTILGEAALVPTVLTDSSTATLTLQTLPGGLDTIYAVYLGDLYYDQKTSNLLTLTVEDFTITPAPTNSPTNLTIVKGSAGSAAFVITGLGGFNNQVQIVCAVPSQDDMTCTATPQQVTPNATVTFVVQTFSSGNETATTTVSRKDGPEWPRAADGTALAALAFFLLPFGKRVRVFVGRSGRRFFVLFLLLVGLGTTGIGCNSVSGPIATGGTPLGVATLKITASAYVDNTVVSKSVYLTVNVVANQ